jgi:hypothetical protein
MNARGMNAMLLAAALAALAACGGCQVFAAFYHIFVPKALVGPEYELPPKKKVLVFPDDMFDPVSYTPAKRALARKVGDMLAEKRVAADVIPYDELKDLEETEPDFHLLEVGTVGRKLGADLVIYIILEPLRLKDSPDDTLHHGRFGGRVRVVDVRQGKIWPEDSAGKVVRIVEEPSDNPSSSYRQQLAVQLGEKLGEKIGNLFVKHYEETMPTPDRLDPLE